LRSPFSSLRRVAAAKRLTSKRLTSRESICWSLKVLVADGRSTVNRVTVGGRLVHCLAGFLDKFFRWRFSIQDTGDNFDVNLTSLSRQQFLNLHVFHEHRQFERILISLHRRNRKYLPWRFSQVDSDTGELLHGSWKRIVIDVLHLYPHISYVEYIPDIHQGQTPQATPTLLIRHEYERTSLLRHELS